MQADCGQKGTAVGMRVRAMGVLSVQGQTRVNQSKACVEMLEGNLCFVS